MEKSDARVKEEPCRDEGEDRPRAGHNDAPHQTNHAEPTHAHDHEEQQIINHKAHPLEGIHEEGRTIEVEIRENAILVLEAAIGARGVRPLTNYTT